MHQTASQTYFSAGTIAEALGMTERSVRRRAGREKWDCQEESCPGGTRRLYPLSGLPADVQTALVRAGQVIGATGLRPKAALELATRLAAMEKDVGRFTAGLPAVAGDSSGTATPGGKWTEERAAEAVALEDDRVARIARILTEAERVPRGMKKRAWVEQVAQKYQTTYQTIYKWRKKHGATGLAGLKHTKPVKGRARAWDEEALDYWIGLNLINTNRKRDANSLYWNVLMVEAERNDWRVGSLRSAYDWLETRLNPLLRAYQKGGRRALDNILPPILRDYSDLAPFEILCGDQHRFDFWVLDEETGEVVRPEGYMWQDLRTRLIYGVAVDRKYDSRLMGLALHIGIRIFGLFLNIYTDHGKPERAKYIMSILKDIRRLGMESRTTMDIDDQAEESTEDDPEGRFPAIRVGEHRWAVVRNAKAKMIEGTNKEIERILVNELRLPGYVKRLTDSAEDQEVDQKEAEALARSGKLPTLSEFVAALFEAADHYNRKKRHRGVYEEWRRLAWGPIDRNRATPMACLEMCYRHEGWRPNRLSQEAAEILFLPRKEVTVNRGLLKFQEEHYEHKAGPDELGALIPLHRKKVEVRFNPLNPDQLLVFRDGEFLCLAEPVERGSMKDNEKTALLNARKARWRKLVYEQYRRLTSPIEDDRAFSGVPAEEKAAAVIGRNKRRRVEERTEIYRVRTEEELAAEVAAVEAREETRVETRPGPDLPERPRIFLKETDRYKWIQDCLRAGGQLSAEDAEFATAYEAGMNAEDREWWEMRRIYG